MAIVVEEDRKKSPMLGVAGWLVFVVILAAAAYFMFFAPAPQVTLPLAGGLSAVAPLVQSPVQPQTVEADPVLGSLHSAISAPTSTGPAALNRPNPFLAP